MEKNNELNELIYEYYKSRILFGIYRYGEQLKWYLKFVPHSGWPGNRTDCVKQAGRGGLYKDRKRKAARVIYQGSEELFRENVVRYFALRREGILDIQLSSNLLSHQSGKRVCKI